MKSAIFYDSLADNKVQCGLCPHRCVIADGGFGVCGVRKNESGVLRHLYYGEVCAVNLDPIEKKPLYHFYPGAKTYSIALPGCNMRCPFCQNWQISQAVPGQKINTAHILPEEIVGEAREQGSSIISYTYTEPIVSYEYVLECMRLAKRNGMKNVLVSNGNILEAPLNEMSDFLDAANIDLKCFTEEGYRYLGGDLKSVTDSIEFLHKKGVWLEVATLVVPGFNDSDEELSDIAQFIAGVSVDMPWHISAFYPTYKMMDRPPTDVQRIIGAEAIGRKAGINYIYPGNIAKEGNTFCPKCGKMLIRRIGFVVTENYVTITGGYCPQCKYTVAGRW